MTDYPRETVAATHPARDDGPKRVRNRRITYGVASTFFTLLVASAVVDDLSERIDIWGIGTAVVTDEAAGYELSVRYPTVSRPALATPFDIVVRRAGGFNGPIDIAIDPQWIEMWDYQSLYPEPSSQTATPDRLVLSFDPPDGDVLRIFFDARIQPSEQHGRSGFVAVLEDGTPVVAVEFDTAVRP